jgi:hypothetical protein
MPSPELERLVAVNLLHHEAPLLEEFRGLVREGTLTLADAKNEGLSLESRFRLAYGAAHSFALAGLRWHGYRPRNRQVVFQALAHTLSIPAPTWRTLAKCHEQRNRQEYEGLSEIDERLLHDLIVAADGLLAAVCKLSPPIPP